MKIQLTKPERMAQNGKGLLRLLQNDSLPLMDLFIRESFQNSLDATIPTAKTTIIDVSVNEFNTKRLADHLEGIGENLIDKYGDTIPKAICISDKNTTGLTGDIRENDKTNLNESNLYKLIYGISMNQEESGTGGSWGLGKTSYFRVGNGIVLYYTRIKMPDGSYEERLAGSLIENSSKSDPLLTDNDRGIAWWGVRESNNFEDTYANTYPITDQNEIGDILDVFGIKQYRDKETGTAIIIPFVNEDQIFIKKEAEQNGALWWEQDLEEIIKLAIQRWYGPRILNPTYREKYGSYLVPSVNGEVLSPDKFEPLFIVISNLYNQALLGESTNKINVKPVMLERMAVSTSENKTVGYFAFSKLSKKELKMLSPDNLQHPLVYLGYDSTELEKTNDKIIAYSRKPGMVVEYDVNSDWSKSTPTFDDQFIIGFFVPRSEAILHERLQGELKVLDDYLRKTENADHAEWNDVQVNNTKVTIIDRIMKSTSRIISDEFGESVEEIKSSRSSALSKKIGAKLLPPTSFGRRATPPHHVVNPNGVEKTSTKHTTVNVTDVRLNSAKNLTVSFQLILKAEKSAKVSIAIRLGATNYTEESWQKDMGDKIQYPFVIQNLMVKNINEEWVNKSSDNLNDERVSIHFSSFSNLSSFIIENRADKKDLIIQGMLTLRIFDSLVQPTITVSEVK